MSEMTIGKYLKQQRTAKSISLESVSQETKITTTQLHNLEKDFFHLLPSKPYIIGYIKSYAKVIGEDAPYLLNLFEESYTCEDTDYFPLKEDVKANPLTKIAISGTLVLGLSVWAIFHFYNKTQIKLTELKSITPQEITAETPLQIETKEIIPPQEIEVTEVKEEVKEEIKEVEKPTFYKITKTLYAFKQDQVKETIEKYLPLKWQNSIISNKQNVYINAAYDDTWLTYKADQAAIRKFVLKKGRSILIRGEVVRIFLGNVKATEMFLNNRPLKIESRTGVKSLIFPQKKKSDYRLPLFVFKDDGSVITSDAN